MLAESLIADYQRDGVIVLRQWLSPEELADARTQVARYQAEQLARLPPGDYTLEPDGRTVRNLWRLEQHDAWFRDFALQPRFLEALRPLLTGEPVLVGVETFNKPALVGSAVPPHQDNAYFCQTPPDVLTLWIALDAATEANGAVEYLPGSHHELRAHRASGVKGNSMGLAEPPRAGESGAFLGIINPGDALVHHCQTIHFSAPNRSPEPRLSLICVYRAAHTATDPGLKATYSQVLQAAAPSP